MQVIIEEYDERYEKQLIELMIELQDYIIQLDNFKILRRTNDFGEIYTSGLMTKVNENDGKIFIAKIEEKVIGCVAGIIGTPTDEELVGCKEIKSGRILELIVNKNVRGKNIGSLLMEAIENYFKQKKCDFIRVEVFEPNKSAYEFYKRHNYNTRLIDMIKAVD